MQAHHVPALRKVRPRRCWRTTKTDSNAGPDAECASDTASLPHLLNGREAGAASDALGQTQEILLRVRRDLSGVARLHAVPRDGEPAALAKALQALQEGCMLLLGPRVACGRQVAKSASALFFAAGVLSRAVLGAPEPQVEPEGREKPGGPKGGGADGPFLLGRSASVMPRRLATPPLEVCWSASWRVMRGGSTKPGFTSIPRPACRP